MSGSYVLGKIVLSEKIFQNTYMVKKLMSHQLKLISLQGPCAVTGFFKTVL